MGLFDTSPDNWLDLFRNSAQNHNLGAGIGADAAGTPSPASLSQSPATPPLGFAAPPPAAMPSVSADGPDIGDRLSAGFQSWAHTPVRNPVLGLADAIQGLSTGQRVDPDGARKALFAEATRNGGAPGSGIDYERLQDSLVASGDLDGAKTAADIAGKNSQNLTARVLRMKGAPEADIAAAIGNPARMQQLIVCNLSKQAT